MFLFKILFLYFHWFLFRGKQKSKSSIYISFVVICAQTFFICQMNSWLKVRKPRKNRVQPTSFLNLSILGVSLKLPFYVNKSTFITYYMEYYIYVIHTNIHTCIIKEDLEDIWKQNYNRFFLLSTQNFF